MTYYVYIITNRPKGTLYIGITNDIERRMLEHRKRVFKGFARNYNLSKLVYIEELTTPEDAITREKQLKKWHRAWKINLIEALNPYWYDLYEFPEKMGNCFSYQ